MSFQVISIYLPTSPDVVKEGFLTTDSSEDEETGPSLNTTILKSLSKSYKLMSKQLVLLLPHPVKFSL